MLKKPFGWAGPEPDGPSGLWHLSTDDLNTLDALTPADYNGRTHFSRQGNLC
jgi:hypothetical protein